MLHASIQGFLFVTVCFCACARAMPEHNFVKLNDSILSFLWISKAPVQHMKQRYNSSSSGTSSNLMQAHIYGSAYVPLCNFRHPRDLLSTTPRRGTLYYYVPNAIFSGIQNFYFPATGLFPRSRLGGTQGTRPTVQVWVPTELRGACSGHIQSREIWQVITVSLSAELEPRNAMENPHMSCFAPLL